jgi:hypothetical protein
MLRAISLSFDDLFLISSETGSFKSQIWFDHVPGSSAGFKFSIGDDCDNLEFSTSPRHSVAFNSPKDILQLRCQAEVVQDLLEKNVNALYNIRFE